jgi:hypothetical protein
VYPKLCQSTTMAAPRSQQAKRTTVRVGMEGGFCSEVQDSGEQKWSADIEKVLSEEKAYCVSGTERSDRKLC